MSYENRKTRIGRVVSDKMQQTVVVSVEWRSQHPQYRKSVKRRTRLMVHDPDGKCSLGDLVKVIETRPVSKAKRWRVAEIIAHQEVVVIPSAEEVVREALPPMEPTPPPAPKVAEPEPAPADVEAGAAAEEEAKPKPKAKRSRPKTEAGPETAEGSTEAAGDEKPKPKRTRAKAATEEATESGDSTGTEKED